MSKLIVDILAGIGVVGISLIWYYYFYSVMKNEYKLMEVYRSMFVFIVQTLNNYGMLFESQPKGYSNVEMKSVQ